MFQTVPRSQYPHTAGPLHSSTTSNIASCSCSPLVFGLHSLHHTMQSSAMLRNTPAQCSGQPAPAAFLRTCRPSPFGRRAPQMARSFGPYGYGPFVGQFGVNTNDRAVREMMQAFEQAMRPSSACQPSQQSSPQSTGDVRLNVDAVETDDAYTYWADVPGLEKSDLKIQVNQQQRQLTVSGERSEPQVAGPGSEANDRKKFERRFGKFSRTVQLPKEADLEGISARVDKGVLKITVFKKISDSNSLQDITID